MRFQIQKNRGKKRKEKGKIDGVLMEERKGQLFCFCLFVVFIIFSQGNEIKRSSFLFQIDTKKADCYLCAYGYNINT